MDAYSPDVERMMQRLYSSLTEKGRRRYAAVEAAKLGHGGVEYIARILGCDPKTIRRGLEELEGTQSLEGDRDRKKGVGASYSMQSIPPWKRIS
jgi:predicted ArsR family transcriptional regulator